MSCFNDCEIYIINRNKEKMDEIWRSRRKNTHTRRTMQSQSNPMPYKTFFYTNYGTIQEGQSKWQQSPGVVNLMLKLVRTPLNVYFTGFKSIVLSLYAPITSYKWHAWFHLNAAGPAARKAEQVNIVHGRIRTTNTAPLDFQRVPLTTRLLGQLTMGD